MKKRVLLISIISSMLLFPIFFGGGSALKAQAAHTHTDDCYAGNKHFHVNGCKKIALTWEEFSFPDPECGTCGGDGFVPSNCTGTLTYHDPKISTRAVELHQYNVFPNYNQYVRSSKYYPQFQPAASAYGYIFCTKCNTYLYVGIVDELFVLKYEKEDDVYVTYDVTIHPFYKTLGNMIYTENLNSIGWPQYKINSPHTFNRCPDCMGETYLCTKCNGYQSDAWTTETSDHGIYPCGGGKIASRIVVRSISHQASVSFPEGYNPGPGFVPPTHSNSKRVYEEYCTHCGTITWCGEADNPSRFGNTIQCSQCNGSYSVHDTWQNPELYHGYGHVGDECPRRFYWCQYCYVGAQTQINICGCDTHNYYDTNKNITPNICNKVVNNISFFQS